MKKPWSITTTIRNPDRLREFLNVLKVMEGEDWSLENQAKYQILLVKNRVYGYGNNQFYNNLSKEQIDLIEDLSKEMSFDQAKKIFESKNYEDPSMRGRQSINVLKKFGFVIIKDGKIIFTELGNYFLNPDSDLGETFFRSFIKWQIPNPDNDDYKYDGGYDIKPFIGVLHLINLVNQKTTNAGEKPKGISRQEFALFAITLVNFKDIGKYADEIIRLRALLKNKTKQEQKKIVEDFQIEFIHKYLGVKDTVKILKNIKDYSDNAIRYFRLTRFIFIRGGGFYIDLEPRRRVEIENLLRFDNGKSLPFKTKEVYLKYMADIKEPKLPWESKEKFIEIIKDLIVEIQNIEKKLEIKAKEISAYKAFNDGELKKYIQQLREYRRNLQEQENHVQSQDVEVINSYIASLENIYEEDDRPTALEKYSSFALHALNDALKIKPNYPVGDDNEPTFTAPAGKPDIECFYKTFNAICEVTMLSTRDQWYNEGQPVMRHLRDFEAKNSDKPTYCLFVAPLLHRDTLNTFWYSVKYEYEGKTQRIIPLTIHDFVELLKTLVALKQKGKFFTHADLNLLFDNVVKSSTKVESVNDWSSSIPGIIASWQKQLVA